MWHRCPGSFSVGAAQTVSAGDGLLGGNRLAAVCVWERPPVAGLNQTAVQDSVQGAPAPYAKTGREVVRGRWLRPAPEKSPFQVILKS